MTMRSGGFLLEPQAAAATRSSQGSRRRHDAIASTVARYGARRQMRTGCAPRTDVDLCSTVRYAPTTGPYARPLGLRQEQTMREVVIVGAARTPIGSFQG